MSDNRKLYYFGFDAEEESIDLVLTHHMLYDVRYEHKRHGA